MPIRYDVRDDEPSIAEWDQVSVDTPEPVANPPAFLAGVAFLREIVAPTRVLLYGEGPDDALRYEWRPYVSCLLADRRLAALARAVADDVSMHPRVPLWSSIRQIAGAPAHNKRWQQQFPDWLDEGFAARCQCKERWDAKQRPVRSSHPVRPRAYEGFRSVQLQGLFEDCDVAGASGHAEFRHPFLDVRLLRFMLAVPAIPWCRNKLIIRRAMRTALPKDVIRRRKVPVPVSPDFERVRAAGFPRCVPAPELLQYVNPDRLPGAPGNERELRAALRPLGLNYWLQRLTDSDHREVHHGSARTPRLG